MAFFRRKILCASALSLLCFPSFAIAADYGDAPDGGDTGYPAIFQQTARFPTLNVSGGINVTDITQATLGPAVSNEADANDQNDTDGQPNLNPSNTDSDDGIVDFVVVPVSIPAPAAMTVNVVGPAASQGGRFFINVLIDMNMNGEWDGILAPGVDEWAVKNFPVMVGANTSQNIALPAFAYANGNRLPDGAWMRIALTDQFIADPDWSGTGQFSAGEVEDHTINLPRIGPNAKSCVPVMLCPDKVRLPDSGAPRAFVCRITNLGADDCTFGYSLNRVTPGADARDLLPLAATCAVNGPAAIGPCGPTGAIPPAASHAEVFLGQRSGNLPSRWTYRAWGIDPDAVITNEGVTIGFGDSVGDVDFIADEKAGKKEKPLDIPQLEKMKSIEELQSMDVLKQEDMPKEELRPEIKKLYELE